MTRRKKLLNSNQRTCLGIYITAVMIDMSGNNFMAWL